MPDASVQPEVLLAEKDVALVVESGPVVYSDEEEERLNEEVIEEGLNDEEMKELAYEGDPLLHSDYEDEGEGRRVMERGATFVSHITRCR